MCGICGKINYGDRPIDEALIRKMCQSFICRGPDDEGVYVNSAAGPKNRVHAGLGHRRLSVIDLSKAGHQPMSNEDGTRLITYNGEIYNFKVLRKELEQKGHIFKSDTDTETVLHLYEEEGARAVERLNGMFAFAVWDQEKKEIFVCRDRIGIKPLVYYWDGKHFVFASEIKALLCDPLIPKEIDYKALQLYLTFSYIPAPHTIFKGIKKLEPGHFLRLAKGELKIEKYWDLHPAIDSTFPEQRFSDQEHFYKKRLFEGLNRAVKDRMAADVPLGAFLSGGIDSSIIVALMAQNTVKPVKTFSIGFKDNALYDETHYARQVAALYHTDHHEFKLTYKDMLDVFPQVLSTFDEPFSDSSAIPTFIVSRETKRHVTVALSGDGGDELFAGYRSYLGEYWYRRYMMVPGVFRESVFEKLVEGLPDSRDQKVLEYIRRLKKFIKSTKGNFAQRMLSLKEIFPGELAEKIILHKENYASALPLELLQGRLSVFQGDRVNRMLYTDVKDSLPGDMLTKVDWMSMKNSLEVRVPFLDHRVVELAFQMPGVLKLRKGITKYILKETFKNILPESLGRRSKAGFEVPISQWLKTDLKFLVDQYLDKERIRRQGIFDYDVIEGLIQNHLNSKTDTSWMLWNLIVFQYWYDEYYL